MTTNNVPREPTRIGKYQSFMDSPPAGGVVDYKPTMPDLPDAELYRPGEWDIDTNYTPLLRPDGTVLTTLTEPEDRQWHRDLEPVVDELNLLTAELRALETGMGMFRQQLRCALFPFWPNNMGVGGDEIVDAVKRVVEQNAALRDDWNEENDRLRERIRVLEGQSAALVTALTSLRDYVLAGEGRLSARTRRVNEICDAVGLARVRGAG